MSDLRTISAEEFAGRLKRHCETTDAHFAFFLGAGCSITSGIPSAGELVKDHWLPQLRNLQAPHEQDLTAWAKKEFPDYSPENPALIYGQVVERLFLQPEETQREIERLCEGKFPGFGYVALASLIAQYKGIFNVVLTTNFDDLVQDALYLFTPARPLVISHEALAPFIRPTRTRPLVVKLHGDHQLAPRNTVGETEKLKDQVEHEVGALLHDRGLIFIGYGGHDHSIQRMLDKMPEESLPWGVYWLGEAEPNAAMMRWLEKRQGVWVKQAWDFDELMLLLTHVLGVPLPSEYHVMRFMRHYRRGFERLADRIEKLPDGQETKTAVCALKQAIKAARESLAKGAEAEAARKKS